MNSTLLEKEIRLSSLQSKINECGKRSLTMKGITALTLLIDFMCAKNGGTILVIISLVVLCLFFFFDTYFLKKKKEYEIKYAYLKWDNINNVKLEACAEENNVRFPVGYYIVIAGIMIVWLIIIS